MIDTNVYLFAARLGGKKREGQKKKEKKRGRCVSREAVGEAEIRRSMRYYDIDGTSVSCGNARYYVLPSELAIDGTTDRSTARGRFNRMVDSITMDSLESLIARLNGWRNRKLE